MTNGAGLVATLEREEHREVACRYCLREQPSLTLGATQGEQLRAVAWKFDALSYSIEVHRVRELENRSNDDGSVPP